MSGGKMIRKLLILLCLLTLMLNGCASEKTKQTAAQENDTEEDSGEKKIQIGLTVIPLLLRGGFVTGMHSWQPQGNWERK